MTTYSLEDVCDLLAVTCRDLGNPGWQRVGKDDLAFESGYKPKGGGDWHYAGGVIDLFDGGGPRGYARAAVGPCEETNDEFELTLRGVVDFLLDARTAVCARLYTLLLKEQWEWSVANGGCESRFVALKGQWFRSRVFLNEDGVIHLRIDCTYSFEPKPAS